MNKQRMAVLGIIVGMVALMGCSGGDGDDAASVTTSSTSAVEATTTSTSAVETTTTSEAESTTTAAADAAAFFEGLATSWTAPPEDLDQPGAVEYGVDVDFRTDAAVGEVVADVTYPELNCSGTWTLSTSDATELTAEEHILDDPGAACIATVEITLERVSDTSIDYGFNCDSGLTGCTATAVLHPA